MFVIISVIYRPIEQLLSRTIADHERARHRGAADARAASRSRARSRSSSSRSRCRCTTSSPHDVFASTTLYWIFVVGDRRLRRELLRARLARRPQATSRSTAAWSSWSRRRASPSRSPRRSGSSTGSRRSRSASPPRRSSRWWSCRRRSRAAPRVAAAPPPATDAALEGPAAEGIEEAVSDLSIRRGGGFAISVSGIQLAEQTLLNAAVLTVAATSPAQLVAPRHRLRRAADHARAAAALPGDPDLAAAPPRGARGDRRAAPAFARAIRVTVLAIAGFALAVALGLLAIGPFVMHHVFHTTTTTTAGSGLALIAVGMGLHLSRRHAQPGGAGARPGGARGGAVARGRGAVRRLDAGRRDRRPGPAHRGRLRGRRRAARARAVGALPARVADGLGQRDVGGGRVGGAEDRRPGDEDARARRARSVAPVSSLDAAVDLDRGAGAKQRRERCAGGRSRPR